MKVALVGLLSVVSASAMSADPKTVLDIVSKSRKLNDQYGDDENAFLMQYSLHLLSCNTGESWYGEDQREPNSVIYRLCPEADCDADSKKGPCSEGYGDYIVGANTFLEAFAEQIQQRRRLDQNFNLREYAECREFDGNQRALGEGEEERDLQYGYYIGPGCTSDGKDIKLTVYSDYMCSTESDKTYEDIAYGRSLPYSDGGIADMASCFACGRYDNGNYELAEFCQRLYEFSGKCETLMEPSGYGFYQNTQQCEKIQEIQSASSSGGSAGKAFGWTILAILIIGIVGYGAYYVIQQKKKSADEKGQEFVSMGGDAA